MNKIALSLSALVLIGFAALAASTSETERLVALLRQVLANRQSMYVSRYNAENDDKAVSASWDYSKTNVVFVLQSGSAVTNTIPAQIMVRYQRLKDAEDSD